MSRAEPVDVLAVYERLLREVPMGAGHMQNIVTARAAIAELIEAANRAHMALIGYLPAHRNAVTDEAIAKVSAAIARVSGGAQ